MKMIKYKYVLLFFGFSSGIFSQSVLTIDDAINTLLTTTSYQVTIGNYDVTYVGDSVDVNYNLETVRLAVSLRDTLILAAIQRNEVLANDTLDKLQRILGIII